MRQNDFEEDADCVCDWFCRRIEHCKNNPRKLHKLITIIFVGDADLAIDAVGSSTEAGEQFAASFLSIYQKRYPNIFQILDEKYVVIKEMHKTSSARSIISDFLFATKCIMLHTAYFPTLCNPALLIHMFNYSLKLDNMFIYYVKYLILA